MARHAARQCPPDECDHYTILFAMEDVRTLLATLATTRRERDECSQREIAYRHQAAQAHKRAATAESDLATARRELEELRRDG